MVSLQCACACALGIMCTSIDGNSVTLVCIISTIQENLQTHLEDQTLSQSFGHSLDTDGTSDI